MLDRQITSFPFIDFRDYPRGIDPINGAEITGLDSIGAAKGIAASLRTSVLSIALTAGRPRRASQCGVILEVCEPLQLFCKFRQRSPLELAHGLTTMLSPCDGGPMPLR